MTYIAWAAYYEGPTDADYFDQLIPRLMEEIVASRGTRNVTIAPTPVERFRGRVMADVASQACAASHAFHLFFVHADTGGRDTERTLSARQEAICREMQSVCDWRPDRCVRIAPRHETEAWVLADPQAVADVLGYRASVDTLALPEDGRSAERIGDPKEMFRRVIRQVAGVRRQVEPRRHYPRIARRQDLSALRRAESFQRFESSLITALVDLRCIERT